MSAVEINIPIFERNLKLFNKKGLRRSYSSILSRYNEYLKFMPLACTDKVVLEVILDKEYVVEFQNILKDKGYTLLGSTNTYHMDRFLSDYESMKDLFKDEADKVLAVQKERDELKSKNKDFEEIENDDVKFYFLPYTKNVETLYDFITTSKNDILKYAKEKDITIMFRVCPFCSQMEGFFGFNFFDADQKGEVVVDFASRLSVGVDFNKFVTVFQGAAMLSGIAKDKEEMASPDLNVHLIAENIIYKEA